MAFSNLRILGLVVGILGLLLTLIFYRGVRWKRVSFILFSTASLFIILISTNPDVITIARNMLLLKTTEYGRVLAILILSNIFLLFFSFYLRAKQENIKIQFDRFIRSFVYEEKSRDISTLEKKIKPITIVIPAFNEAENLKEILLRIPKEIYGIEVGTIVIDDGSDDATSYIASSMSNTLLIRTPINRGGGAALRLGYDFLKRTDCQICVTMDADYQHRPEEIEKLIIPILENKYDIVIGSRILGTWEKDNIMRHIGVYFFGILMSLLLGKRVTDPSSGYRAFKIKKLNTLILQEDQYHTSELIIQSIKRGLKVGEIPITIMKRKYGKSKKGIDLLYGLHFTRLVIKNWWR